MIIEQSTRFRNELNQITDFIATDSPQRAESFQNEIIAHIERLKDSPKLGRPSYYAQGVRDFIIKGYTIPYLIDDEKIVILGIFKSNLWSYKGEY